jgi:hypothetical protein
MAIQCNTKYTANFRVNFEIKLVILAINTIHYDGKNFLTARLA